MNKRAIMGIGTLIIFIATILVAAVAAAVIISTSNVLQQRALLVGQESRKAITNAVDIISIMASSNATTEEINNFEILMRLAPGSDALQMRTFDLQFISPDFDNAATLAFSFNNVQTEMGRVNGSQSVVRDLDGDGLDDYVYVHSRSGNEQLFFNLTDGGITNAIDLGVDLAGAGATAVLIDLEETAILTNDSYYGVVEIYGRTNETNAINASVGFAVKDFGTTCTFASLPPEDKYCFEIITGDTDYVLNDNERFKIKYRLYPSNVLNTSEDIQFIFNNDKGRLTEAGARTPDVIVSSKVKLWPLG